MRRFYEKGYDFTIGGPFLALVVVRPNAMNAKVNQRQQRHQWLKKRRRDTGQSIIKRFWSGMLSMILLLKIKDKSGLFAELGIIHLEFRRKHLSRCFEALRTR